MLSMRFIPLILAGYDPNLRIFIEYCDLLKVSFPSLEEGRNMSQTLLYRNYTHPL
jgi:hypothetical protein